MNISLEQARCARARIEQTKQQMTMALLMGYEPGTQVNEAGNVEKPVKGSRVDTDPTILKSPQALVAQNVSD